MKYAQLSVEIFLYDLKFAKIRALCGHYRARYGRKIRAGKEIFQKRPYPACIYTVGFSTLVVALRVSCKSKHDNMTI